MCYLDSSKTERNTAKFNYLYHIFFGKDMV